MRKQFEFNYNSRTFIGPMSFIACSNPIDSSECEYQVVYVEACEIILLKASEV